MKNVIALDPDTNQYNVLTPQLFQNGPPLLFKTTQVQTAVSTNTFTAQDAGIHSQKRDKFFWNRVLLPRFLIIHYNNFLVNLLAINI